MKFSTIAFPIALLTFGALSAPVPIPTAATPSRAAQQAEPSERGFPFQEWHRSVPESEGDRKTSPPRIVEGDVKRASPGATEAPCPHYPRPVHRPWKNLPAMLPGCSKTDTAHSAAVEAIRHSQDVAYANHDETGFEWIQDGQLMRAGEEGEVEVVAGERTPVNVETPVVGKESVEVEKEKEEKRMGDCVPGFSIGC